MLSEQEKKVLQQKKKVEMRNKLNESSAQLDKSATLFSIIASAKSNDLDTIKLKLEPNLNEKGLFNALRMGAYYGHDSICQYLWDCDERLHNNTNNRLDELFKQLCHDTSANVKGAQWLCRVHPTRYSVGVLYDTNFIPIIDGVKYPTVWQSVISVFR